MNSQVEAVISKNIYPIVLVVIKIAAVWAIINVGYYFILPLLGLSLSYNKSPISIAIYFLAWLVFAVWYFRDILSKWITVSWWLLLYLFLSLAGATILCGILYLFSFLPILQGPLRPPYTDLLFATPWYFLPKAVEILIQQLLITVFIAELYFYFKTLSKVILGYILCFGGAHIILFLINGASAPYAIIMTVAAFLTSFMFPYLIVKVRAGFLYAYMIHFSFYVVLAVVLRVLPPPGYFA